MSSSGSSGRGGVGPLLLVCSSLWFVLRASGSKSGKPGAGAGGAGIYGGLSTRGAM